MGFGGTTQGTGVGLSEGPVPSGKHPFSELKQGTHCGSGGTTHGIRVTPPLLEDVVDDDGERVKVSPSVVIVLTAVTLGNVTVSDPPIIIIPELDTTVWPSGSVNVTPPAGPVVELVVEVEGMEVLVVEVEGRKVNVSPSVVKIEGEVSEEGTEIVSLPPMIRTPELETTT